MEGSTKGKRTTWWKISISSQGYKNRKQGPGYRDSKPKWTFLYCNKRRSFHQQCMKVPFSFQAWGRHLIKINCAKLNTIDHLIQYENTVLKHSPWNRGLFSAATSGWRHDLLLVIHDPGSPVLGHILREITIILDSSFGYFKQFNFNNVQIPLKVFLFF